MKNQLLLAIALIMFLSYLSTDVSAKIDLNELYDVYSQPVYQWSRVEQFLDQGSMNGFFTASECTEIFELFIGKYQNISIVKEQIGNSIQKRPINAYAITQGVFNSSKEQILYTSVHHARELLSASMSIYLYLQIIYHILHQNSTMLEITNQHIFWFVPIINIDSYEAICSHFKQRNIILQLRKNARETGCSDRSKNGIDLNRNYGFKFAQDNAGSSGDLCAEDYRGQGPFSEPETQAIRNLIGQNPKIRLAFNLHTFGNLWITPYNYDRDQANGHLQKQALYYQIYSEIKNQAPFSTESRYGNAIQTIYYPANGEASDWMLGEKQIIAFSPELSTDFQSTHTFTPKQDLIVAILQFCAKPLNYIVGLSQFQPKVKSTDLVKFTEKRKFLSSMLSTSEAKLQEQLVLVVEIWNKGILNQANSTGYVIGLKFGGEPKTTQDGNSQLRAEAIATDRRLVQSIYYTIGPEIDVYSQKQLDSDFQEISLASQAYQYHASTQTYLMELKDLRRRSLLIFHVVLDKLQINILQELHLNISMQTPFRQETLGAFQFDTKSINSSSSFSATPSSSSIARGKSFLFIITVAFTFVMPIFIIIRMRSKKTVSASEANSSHEGQQLEPAQNQNLEYEIIDFNSAI